MDGTFQQLYRQKCVTAAQAAGMLKDGAVCFSDLALAQTQSFYQCVAQRFRDGELHDVTQHSIMDMGAAPFFSEELAGRYKGISWFSGAAGRKGVNNGWGDVMPSYYRDIPGLVRDILRPEIMVVRVSPMDRHGYFSTGCIASITPALLDTAKDIYLEVNSTMPRCLSAPQIHISQVTALWECSDPIPCLPRGPMDEDSAKIGRLIAEEIPNGATLQLGIGAIPDAVGAALKDKRHLGIHTELFTDSMMDLIDCGAVDNSCKPIHRGKTVATFAAGSKHMYEYVDDNPMVEILPVDYVNDPAVIARHPNFVSINAALEVDFYGQVCAESLGTYHVSGTGGQADYVRGAIQSQGGQSFIAFLSTAKNGAASRIMPTLSTGALVSTSKNDVDNVVTEYGIAKLRGRTLSQRTKALIAIAHPKFREELTYAAKKQNIII